MGDRAGGPHAEDRPQAAASDRAGGPHAPTLCPFWAKREIGVTPPRERGDMRWR